MSRQERGFSSRGRKEINPVVAHAAAIGLGAVVGSGLGIAYVGAAQAGQALNQETIEAAQRDPDSLNIIDKLWARRNIHIVEHPEQVVIGTAVAGAIAGLLVKRSW